MSQKEQILSHLKQRGTLTALEALQTLNCMRLAARIEELRGAGHDIQTIREHKNEKWYARYLLRSPARG